MQQLPSLGNEGVLVLESLVRDWRPPFTMIALFCFYCFVKGVSLLSSWVTGEGLSKNSLPLLSAPFAKLWIENQIYPEISSWGTMSQRICHTHTPDKNSDGLEKIKQDMFAQCCAASWENYESPDLWWNLIFSQLLLFYSNSRESEKHHLAYSTQ